MIVSECCGAPFREPGYPDTDLCGKCYEHTDAYEDNNKERPISEQIKDFLLLDMTQRRIESNENNKN